MPVTKNSRIIDAKLGRYIRNTRILKGFKQVELATLIGVTFQQLQKYETGSNRLYMGRLIQICEALQIDLISFFTGFKLFLYGKDGDLHDPGAGIVSSESNSGQDYNSKEVINLLKGYHSIRSVKVKKHINNLIKDLSHMYVSG